MEEMLDVVNENDEVLRQASRKEAEAKGLLYRASHVFVFFDGRIIVEKRSQEKSKRPGHYSIVGETVQAGENFEHAARRGVHEETGLMAENLRLLRKIIIHDEKEKDNMVYSDFMCKGTDTIKKQDSEVEEILFMGEKEIEEFIKKEKKITPAFIAAFNVYKEAKND